MQDYHEALNMLGCARDEQERLQGLQGLTDSGGAGVGGWGGGGFSATFIAAKLSSAGMHSQKSSLYAVYAENLPGR